MASTGKDFKFELLYQSRITLAIFSPGEFGGCDEPKCTSGQSHRRQDPLSADGLKRVRAFEEQLRTIPIGWLAGRLPNWLNQFVDTCNSDVPFSRLYDSYNDFNSIAACD